MLQEFLNNIRNKSIHIVGVTGSEGSSILRLLRKHGITHITSHDFLSGNSVEKSFKLWHKGISAEERNEKYHQFLSDLEPIQFYKDKEYLKDIDQAEIIFVPQSWRLYKQNNRLIEVKNNGVPFYSLTRIYLDLTPATVIAVTGTVGKGSVVNLLAKILISKGFNVYVAGNDTWMSQIADRIDEMKKNDILILEISHRQLMDGFTRAPHIAVLTNLYPNHLDEVSYDEYKKLKLLLFNKQKNDDYAVVNSDIDNIEQLSKGIKSNIIYFSLKSPQKNIKSVQKIINDKLDKISNHYLENILAACATGSLFDIDSNYISGIIPQISTLPARLQNIGSISGINFFDDIKSTTPWATMAAISKIKEKLIIICGGRTKGIDYSLYAKQIIQNNIKVIVLKSDLSDKLVKLLPSQLINIVYSAYEAIASAYKISSDGDNIIISPSAGFFYTDFIKGKKSLRDIVTSLPPKEQL